MKLIKLDKDTLYQTKRNPDWVAIPFNGWSTLGLWYALGYTIEWAITDADD